jgi:hypothetical protein
MNLAYDAHLGLYVGTPEVVNHPGSQQFYVTDSLATQKCGGLLLNTASTSNNSPVTQETTRTPPASTGRSPDTSPQRCRTDTTARGRLPADLVGGPGDMVATGT